MPALALTVFISSPGDVGQERQEALRVLKQLEAEFGGAVTLRPVRWEDYPLEATRDFASQIPRPSEADVVICIFWSRLGTPLPPEYQPQAGAAPPSGTEFEFEDAYRASREHGKPALLVYLKTAQLLQVSRDAKALQERGQQMQALDQFFDRWFRNPDASLKGAFHPFESLDEFVDLLTTHLRQKIQARLAEAGPASDARPAAAPPQAQITWRKGSPYRGLDVFDAEHAAIFFGRTRAVGDIKEILNSRSADRCSFLLIFGMSGCGKSSLVRAGVLPRITQPGVIEGIGLWRSCLFLPSRASGDLFDGLALSLLGPGALPELEASLLNATELAALLREAPQRAPALIEAALARAAGAEAKRRGLTRSPAARMVVVVDQMEELFTHEGTAKRQGRPEREGFITVLSQLARSGVVWVIATMRSDFFPRCEEIPELIALKMGTGTYHLLSPSHAEIRQMIGEPARAAGLRFEQDRESGLSLDDVLHEAAGRNPEALPLLEFTLDELFQRSENGLLSFAAYRELGGLEGALARRADEVLASMDEAAQQALPSLLRALVTVDEGAGRQIAARRMPRHAPSRAPAFEALMEAFIDARLLVTDRADDGQAVVRVAHEALLHHWPRAQEWLQKDREFLRARDDIAEWAGRWQESKSPDHLLRARKDLAVAEDLLEQRREDLDGGLVEFIKASERGAARARRKRRLGVALAFAVVSGFSLFSFRQWKTAERQTDTTLQTIAGFLTTAESFRRILVGVPERTSVPLLIAVYQSNLDLLGRLPDVPNTSRSKATNHQLLANLYLRQGQAAKALVECEQCVAIGRKLARETGKADDQLNLALFETEYGEALREEGEIAGALAAYQQSVQICRRLAVVQPGNKVQEALWFAYLKIGDLQFDQRHTEEAAAAYRQAMAQALILARDKQDVQAHQRDLLASYERIGGVLKDKGLLQASSDAYEQSLRLAREVAQSTGDDRDRQSLGIIAAKLAAVRRELGGRRKASAVAPKMPAVALESGGSAR